jgi:hypothetical protein
MASRPEKNKVHPFVFARLSSPTGIPAFMYDVSHLIFIMLFNLFSQFHQQVLWGMYAVIKQWFSSVSGSWFMIHPAKCFPVFLHHPKLPNIHPNRTNVT